MFSLFLFNEGFTQRFSTYTSTDCGNLNIDFAINGGLDFCEGDTVTLINSTDSIFDFYVIDWSHGKLDTVYDKKDLKHVYYFPDSMLCPAPPLAVYFLGVKNCKNNKQTKVWGAYGISHIYRPLADFGFDSDSVCYGRKVCVKSHACNADSIVWNYNNEAILTDSCYTFNSSGPKIITMIAFNKCASDTVTKILNVVEYPSARVDVSTNVKNNSVCIGDTVTFINASNSWSKTSWSFPPLDDKIWQLDTTISNVEKSLPYDTIVYFDTIRFIVLDTGILKFRLNSKNPCDSITWDYNLKVVESAIIQFKQPERYCETAYFTPEVNIIGDVDKYNWSFQGGIPATSLSPSPKNIYYDKTGTYTVILRATNSCGTSMDSIQIFVDAKPTLRIDSINNKICKSAEQILLNASLPGGTWLGTGVDSNGVFDPTDLMMGIYEIIYSTKVGGCAVSDTIQLFVVDTTIVVALPTSLCINTAPSQILVTPPGGIFSGPGINAFGLFDPTLTGLGAFLVTYTYTDSNGCNSLGTTNVTVELPPEISNKDSLIICIGNQNIDLSQALELNSNPTGGKYSFILNGKPVNPIINSANYKAGTFQILINYQINLCTVQDTATIIFIQTPVLIVSNDTILCDRDGIFRLQTNLPGGFWTGPGVNPTTGLIDLLVVITDTAVYTYTFQIGISCEATQQCTIYIDDKGKGIRAGQDVSFCKDNSAQFDLTGFSPVGGSWIGTGIIDDSIGRIDLSKLISDSAYVYHYCMLKPLASPCTFCDSIQFTMHSLPVADFDIVGSACLNMNFSLDNRSIGADTYFWEFGDGTTSTLQSPKHNYIDTGNHVLRLTVTNQYGCVSQSTKNIDVTPNPPIASFSLDSLSGCAPFVLSLKNQSSGDNINYTWRVGDSTYLDSLPVLIIDDLTKDSTFKILLTVMSGCGMVSDSQFVTVRPYPKVDFGIDSFEGCTPLEINFANASVGNIDQFFWDMGNGNIYNTQNPPKQIYTTTDSTITKYLIKLIGINECGIDSLVKVITVNPPNVLAFIEPSKTKICQYDSLWLKSYSTPGSLINWKILHPSGFVSTSNTKQIHFGFDAPGKYVIHLHASKCGEDFDTTIIEVLPAPKVDFELPAYLCLNDTAYFKNSSFDIGGSEWDFGDGATSNATDANHRFSKPGKYTIRLTGYSTINNCPYTISKDLVVIGAPIAHFTASSVAGCSPLSVDFTNKSIGATKYNWMFSDNSSNSLLENPNHVFLSAGTYSVVLQVLDTNQCFSDTSLMVITVYPSPRSSFAFDKKSYCFGKDTISLINTSSGAMSYSWEIDSTASDVTNPKYFSKDTGIVGVRLVSTNIFGCRDTSFGTVNVIPSPESHFVTDKNNGCEDLQIQMSNLSRNATNFVWDFGDGNSSTSKSPSHLFKDPGQIVVSLISMGTNGCPPDTAEHSIVVWPLPNAEFVIKKDSTCGVPMHVLFTNNSLNSANYNWALDGIPISTNTETEYTFDKVGDYNMSLLILSAYGCTDSTEKIVSIYEQPVADFTLDNEACESTSMQLYNTSKNANDYQWHFESVGYSNELNPQISFGSTGVYDIELIASYNAYCKDTLLKKGFIKIYSQPVADFSCQLDVDKQIAGDVQFTNLSKNFTDQKWIFGDGMFSVMDNPIHVYAANQSMNASLFVYHHNSGLFTCIDSITKSIGPIWVTTFFAPNALSPEYGEEKVRVFKPVGHGLEAYEISIYSPWGERVWYSEALQNNSPIDAWDGTYKNAIVPQGSYTWLAKLTFINGNKKIAKGTVTVLR